MTIVGFHASHEQVPPARLLHAVQRAEEAGFDAAMCSDHFAPWSVRQGESGFAWSWLGAALQATRLPFGVVTAPGQRYHPAIAAQAIATLEPMYPGRFWAALGSGEAINEHITGDAWPAEGRARRAPARDRRRHASAARRRGGQRTTGSSTSIALASGACPTVPPPLFGAAGQHRDGRASAPSGPTASSRSTSRATPLRAVIDAYRDAGGRGPDRPCRCTSAGRPPTTRRSRSRTTSGARASCPRPLAWELDDARGVRRGDRRTPPSTRSPRPCSSPPTRRGTSPGSPSSPSSAFDRIYLHHVGVEQDALHRHVRRARAARSCKAVAR